MKQYKIKYQSGASLIVEADSALDVIKQFSLATREHIKTRVIELEGEQEAIAISNRS